MSTHSDTAFISTQQAVERTLITHPATVYNSAACQSTRPRACKCQMALPIQQSSAHVSMAAWPGSHGSSPGCVFVLRSMHRHASATTASVEHGRWRLMWRLHSGQVSCRALRSAKAGRTTGMHACRARRACKPAGLAHTASGSQGRRKLGCHTEGIG
jgi:hypothetical protein